MTKNTISAGSTGGGQCPAHNPHTRPGQYSITKYIWDSNILAKIAKKINFLILS